MSRTLPRINVEKFDTSLAEARQKLLADAAEKLHYQPASTDSLLYKLVQLGIAPFQTSAVEEYQKSKTRTSMRSGTRKWFIWLGVNLVVAATALYFGFAGHFNNPVPALLLAIPVGVSIVVMCLASMDMVGSGTRTVWKWDECPINSYERTIPDHVLNTALQIKEAIPSATFRVHYLAQHQDRLVRVDPDPFLKVFYNNQWFYVEQWDEQDLPRYDS